VATRRVLRPQIVANRWDKEQSVKVTLVHQRKSPKSGAWEDSPPFSLSTVKAGEEVRLPLDTNQTWHLYRHLRNLYAIGAEGVPRGEGEVPVPEAKGTVMLEGKAREVVQYFEQHGEDLWHVVDELKPDLLEVLALQKRHEARRRAVEEFRAHAEQGDWSEDDWQTFFVTHTWIFGHNLAYRFLGQIQAQPHYGGTTLSGAGGQRGDMLYASLAEARFTVLVEIKKPDTPLLSREPYRNKAYGASPDLAGAIAQLQSNCRTWVLYGSRQEENEERLRRENVSTYEPKGILVIGHCRQLGDDPNNPNKKASFELLRRNLHNPEVITYDELLARAEFLTAAPPTQLTGLVPDGAPGQPPDSPAGAP
jgi:hypothetical protein